MGNQLDKVRFDEGIGLVHSDPRRDIYDPKKFFQGIDGQWYSHNVITLRTENLELGNHFHDYEELFLTTNGEFVWRLVDTEDNKTRKYILKPGNRLLIPARIGHVVIGKPGDVLLGYGTALDFDPERTFPCSKPALEALASIK